MADQVAAKKILSELSKREDLHNKSCADCSNPNPQWASLSFAIFICLQCAGVHRGFVRSISMDTWQDEQVRRMQLGGNLSFKDFMKSYQPADQGGYKPGASPYDTYHCWAAAQYREKLDAMLAGRDWSPSAPPANFSAGSRSASPAPSAQALRKSRASTRTLTNRSDSGSPAPSFRSSPNSTPSQGLDQKTMNENYFASLGKANESRPDDLPPSQGGRYTGFGSTPTPPSNQNPAYGLSSANAPSLSELQENPVAAISKGWSLFAAAVAGASRVVAENVIQPGVEKVTDPNFQASVMGYMTEAQKKAAMVGGAANEWSKNQFGVDVVDTVGGVVGTVKDRVAGPSRSGYGSLSLTSPNDMGESSGLYDADDDDLFTEYRGTGAYSPQTSALHTPPVQTQTKAASDPKKSSDWDDEWKDF
ncbi:ADP-ribosylation factor GTPase-activating protein GCS1 [Psilocybe cubensis]|uniref:Arf-GAP domain-containing protein n=2 Tax=Psilocybe cubensis TaxID=181762 RepID=A0A8H8CL73_PSICU|nr:ADP-ribosylation factor GTPase-activating protein GCS1 [Psilocybe cubensis]KAH9482527.1 ADP-ribosylation factor GTPase-activating protein GCS1 [Psilocybe cubensis]